MELTTDSGYKVKIKRNYLTRAESLQIKEMNMKMIQSSTKLSAFESSKDADVNFDFSLQLYVDDKIFELLTESLTTPDGQVISTKILEHVNGLRDSIGDEIIKRVIKEVNRKEAPASGEKNSAVI